MSVGNHLAGQFANRILDVLRRAGRATDGSVALFTALALPVVLLVSLGAVQLQGVVSAKAKIQDVADSAALWGAQQLTITSNGVIDRTQAWATAQLEDVAGNSTTLTVAPSLVDKRVIKVSIDANMPSFFMNMFPTGGFNVHAESVAEGLHQSPLCVLVTGAASNDHVDMQNSAKLQGPACLVHSNQDISVAGTAMLRALTVEAGGGASGPITPTASTSAPTLEDPFLGVDIDFPSACPVTLPFLALTNITLQPGVHCFNYDVQSNTTLTLAPGNHYFAGYIRMKSGARMTGTDVVLVFSATSTIDFKNAADITLSGRETGPLAGFVMAVSRQNTGNFDLEADHISAITGTIYSPNAILRVSGAGQAANLSQWTVVAARSLELSGSPTLIINADYSGSVPVPAGVGNRAGVTHLVQ